MSGSITVKVKYMGGNPIPISLRPDQTISDLKQQLATQIKVSVGEQKLQYKGKVLENSSKVADVLVHDAQVHCVKLKQDEIITAPPAQPVQPMTPAPAPSNPTVMQPVHPMAKKSAPVEEMAEKTGMPFMELPPRPVQKPKKDFAEMNPFNDEFIPGQTFKKGSEKQKPIDQNEQLMQFAQMMGQQTGARQEKQKPKDQKDQIEQLVQMLRQETGSGQKGPQELTSGALMPFLNNQMVQEYQGGREGHDEDDDPEFYSKEKHLTEMPSDYERAKCVKSMQSQDHIKLNQQFQNHPARMAEFFRNNPEMRKQMENDPTFKEWAENPDKIRALGKIALLPETQILMKPNSSSRISSRTTPQGETKSDPQKPHAPSSTKSVVQELEDKIDEINKLRNRAHVLSALKHLCSIAKKILNNPSEGAPRKVYKTDDVLVEDLFVLPEAAELLRMMGFREEDSYFTMYYGKSDSLAEIHELLTRKKDVISATYKQELIAPPVKEFISAVEANRREKDAAAKRVQEQIRLDRLEKQKDLEHEAIRSKKSGAYSQASAKSQIEEDDRNDCVSVLDDEMMQKFTANNPKTPAQNPPAPEPPKPAPVQLSKPVAASTEKSQNVMGIADLKEPEEPKKELSLNISDLKQFLESNQSNPLISGMIRAFSGNNEGAQPNNKAQTEAPKPTGVTIGGSSINPFSSQNTNKVPNSFRESDDEDLYRDQLFALKQVGFLDKDLNLAVLRKTKGNEQMAIHILYQLRNKF